MWIEIVYTKEIQNWNIEFFSKYDLHHREIPSPINNKLRCWAVRSGLLKYQNVLAFCWIEMPYLLDKEKS